MSRALIVSLLFLCAACSAGRRFGTTDGGGVLDDAGSVTTHDGGVLPHDGGATTHDGSAAPGDAAITTHDAGPSGPPGTPAHIEIYSGNGIMMDQGFPGGDALKVIITDAAGSPVSGVPVTWTVVSGGVGVNGDGFSTGTTGVTMSDANGIARAGVRGAFASSMESALESRISATCAVGSVEFHVFSTYSPPGAIPTMPATYIVTPDSRDFGTMTRGSVRAGGLVSIVVHMNGSEMGHGLAGVGMRFIASDDSTADTVPVVSCANATEGVRAGGTVFTDDTGHATCDMQAPSTPGDYPLTIFVGGALRFGPFFLHVS